MKNLQLKGETDPLMTLLNNLFNSLRKYYYYRENLSALPQAKILAVSGKSEPLTFGRL